MSKLSHTPTTLNCERRLLECGMWKSSQTLWLVCLMTAEAESQRSREEEESSEPMHFSKTTSESRQSLGSPAAPHTGGGPFWGRGLWTRLATEHTTLYQPAS